MAAYVDNKTKNVMTHQVGHGGTRPKDQVAKYPQDQDSSNLENGVSHDHFDDTPLDKKEISIYVKGMKFKKKALHPDWIEPKIFVECSHPQFLTDDTLLLSGGIDTWVEEISFLCSDLEWLLGLPYHKFWSQIIYDNSVHTCLDSFLSTRLRWFDNLAYNADMVSIAERADQLVFLVYLRMATYKETQIDHITPSVFGELVYDNYIFDCCKFVDLCVLYGNSNMKILNKMMHNVFSNQPKYKEDLRMLVSSLKNVLSNIEKELGIFPDRIPIPLKQITDVISFMADNFFSVFSFLKVYPEASSIFQEEQYLERLATFYQAVIPFISENLSYYSQNKLEVEEFKRKFDMSRIGALSLFKHLLQNICIHPLRNNKVSCDELEKCITYFIHITTTAAEEKIFITDYDSMFGFVDDFNLFKEAGADITPLDYIKNSVSRSVEETLTDYGWQSQAFESKTTSQTVPPSMADDTSGMNGYFHANQEESSVEVFSLIANVQDLLPELGTGFIRECLKHYSYSVEDTLNAIFECTLPAHIDSLDRSKVDDILPEKKAAAVAEPEKPVVKTILDDRGNVYNGDEFDTFSNKDTLKRVRTGKQPSILKAPDEDLMKKLKEIGREYEKSAGYSIYEDELKYTPIHATDYEDEYDDTYDGGYFKANMRNLEERGPTIFGRGALNVKGIDFDATPSDSSEDNDTAVGTNQTTSNAPKRINNKGPLYGKNSSKPDNVRKTDRNFRKGDNVRNTEGNSRKGDNVRNTDGNSRKGDNVRNNDGNSRKGDNNRKEDGFSGDSKRKGDSNRNGNNSRRVDGFRNGDNNRKGDNRFHSSDTSQLGGNNKRLQNSVGQSYEAAVAEVSSVDAEPEVEVNQNRGWKPQDFCENPEDVRQRAEDRRRTKMASNKRRPAIGEQQYPMREYPSAVRPKNQPDNSGKPQRQECDKLGRQKGSDINTTEPAENKATDNKTTDNRKVNNNKGKQQQEDGNAAGKKKDTGDKNAYRKKNIHKNEHKRFGAQAKARGRF